MAYLVLSNGAVFPGTRIGAPGDRIMVHSSYKSFGSFEKGPEGIIEALQESVTQADFLIPRSKQLDAGRLIIVSASTRFRFQYAFPLYEQNKR